MKYSISIALFNNLALTRQCLGLLFQSCPEEFELLLTDNFSTDGTREYITALPFTRKVVILNEQNIGFGAAHNRALEVARGEYFVVLNNDIFIYERSWLTRLAAPFAERPKLAITGLQGSPCMIVTTPEIKGVWHPTIVEYVEASCLMIPTALAGTHGLFSPELEFAYFEDADLSLRYRQMGYEILLVGVDFRHLRAQSANLLDPAFLTTVFKKNEEVFKRKWSDYLKTRSFR